MTSKDDEHASQDNINNEEDGPLEEAVRWMVERAMATAIAEDVVEDILDHALMQIFREDGDLWVTSEEPPSIPDSEPDCTRPKLMEEDMVVGDTCGAMLDEINKIISGIHSMSITSPSAGSLEDEVKKMISAISNGEHEQRQHPEDLVLNTMEGQRHVEATTDPADSDGDASVNLEDKHEDENGHVSGELLQRMIVELQDDPEVKATTEQPVTDKKPTPITIKLEDKKEYYTFKIQTIPETKVMLDEEQDLIPTSVEITSEEHIHINVNAMKECLETSVQACQPKVKEDSIIATSDNCISSIAVWRPNPFRSYLLHLNACIAHQCCIGENVPLPAVQKASNLLFDSDDNEEYQSESDGSTTWEEQEVQTIDPDDGTTAEELPIQLHEPSRAVREKYAKSCFGLRTPPKQYPLEYFSLPSIRNVNTINIQTREGVFIDSVPEKDRNATQLSEDKLVSSTSEKQPSVSSTNVADDVETIYCDSHTNGTEPTSQTNHVRPSASFKRRLSPVTYNCLRECSSPRPNLHLSSDECVSEYFALHISTPNEKFLSSYSIKDYIANTSAVRFELLTEAGALIENTDIIRELRHESISDQHQQRNDPSEAYTDNPLAVISRAPIPMSLEPTNNMSNSTNFIYTNPPSSAFNSLVCSSDSMGGYFPYDKLSHEYIKFSPTELSDKLVISEYVENNSLVKTTSEQVTGTTDYLDQLEVLGCVTEQDKGPKSIPELDSSITKTIEDTKGVTHKSDSQLNELDDDNINNCTGEVDISVDASITTGQTYGENNIQSQNKTQPSMVTNPCDQILIINYDQNMGRQSALFLHSASPAVGVAPESRVPNYNPMYEGEYVLQLNPIGTEQTYKTIDDKDQIKMHVTGDKSSSPIPIYVATVETNNRTIRPAQEVNSEGRSEDDNRQVTTNTVAQDGGVHADHSVDDPVTSHSPNVPQVSTGSVSQETEESWQNIEDQEGLQELPDEDENALDCNMQIPAEFDEVHPQHISPDEGFTEDLPESLNTFEIHLNLQEINDENVNELSQNPEQRADSINQQDNTQRESSEHGNTVDLYAYDVIEQHTIVESLDQQDVYESENHSQNATEDTDPSNNSQVNSTEIHEHKDQSCEAIFFVNTHVDQCSYFDHTYAAVPTEIVNGGSLQGEETIGSNPITCSKDIILEPVQPYDSMVSINEPPIREMAYITPREENSHKETHMEDHTYATVATESTNDNKIQDNNTTFSDLQTHRKDIILESIRSYEEGKTSMNDQCVEKVIATSLRDESVQEESRIDDHIITTTAMEPSSEIIQQNEHNTCDILDIDRRNGFQESIRTYTEFEISTDSQCVEEVVVTSSPVVGDLTVETIDTANNVNPHDQNICVSPEHCVVILEPINPHDQCWNEVFQASTHEENTTNETHTENITYDTSATENSIETNLNEDAILCGSPDTSSRSETLKPIRTFEAVSRPESEHKAAHIEDHTYAATEIETITDINSQDENRMCSSLNNGPIDSLLEALQLYERDQDSLKKHCSEGVVQMSPPEKSGQKLMQTEENAWAAVSGIDAIYFVNPQDTNMFANAENTRRDIILEPIPPQEQIAEEVVENSPQEENDQSEIDTEDHTCAAVATETNTDLNVQNANIVCDSSELSPRETILEPVPPQEQVVEEVVQISLQDERDLKEETMQAHTDGAAALEITINLNSDNENICSSAKDLSVEPTPPHEPCWEDVQLSPEENSGTKEINMEDHTYAASVIETIPVENPRDETFDIVHTSSKDNLEATESYKDSKTSVSEQCSEVVQSSHTYESDYKAIQKEDLACKTVEIEASNEDNPLDGNINVSGTNTCSEEVILEPKQSSEEINTSMNKQSLEKVVQMSLLDNSDKETMQTEENASVAAEIETNKVKTQDKNISCNTDSVNEDILNPVEFHEEDKTSMDEQIVEKGAQESRCAEESDKREMQTNACGCVEHDDDCCVGDTSGKGLPSKPIREDENKTSIDDQYSKQVVQTPQLEENNQFMTESDIFSSSWEESELRKVQTEDNTLAADATETTDTNLQNEYAFESTQSCKSSMVLLNEQSSVNVDPISPGEEINPENIPTEEAIKHEISDDACVDNNKPCDEDTTEKLKQVEDISAENPIYIQTEVRENDTNSNTSDTHETFIQAIERNHPQSNLNESQNTLVESSETISKAQNKNPNIDHGEGSAHDIQVRSSSETDENTDSCYMLALTDTIEKSEEIDQHKLELVADGKEDSSEDLDSTNQSEISQSITEEVDGVSECANGRCCGETQIRLGDTIVVGLDICNLSCLHNQITLQDNDDDEHNDESLYSYDEYDTTPDEVMELIECNFADVHTMPREKESSDLYELYDENTHHIFKESDIIALSNVIEGAGEFVEMPNFDQTFISSGLESRMDTDLGEVFDYYPVGDDFLLLARRSDNDEMYSLRSNGSSENGEQVHVRTIVDMEEVTPLLGASSESEESVVSGYPHEEINSPYCLYVDNPDGQQSTENVSHTLLQEASDTVNETQEEGVENIQHQDNDEVNSEITDEEKSSTRIYWTSVGLMKEHTNNPLDLCSDLFSQERKSRQSETSFIDLEDQGDFSPKDMFEEKEGACALVCTDAIQSDWSAVYCGSELATVQESGQESINESGEAVELTNEEASCSVNEERDVSLEEEDSINAVQSEKAKKKKRKWKIGSRLRKFFSNMGSSKRDSPPAEGK